MTQADSPPSCILLFLSIDHTEKGPGPFTKHKRDESAADPEAVYLEKEETGIPPQSAQTDGTSALQGEPTATYAAPAAEEVSAHPGLGTADARPTAEAEQVPTRAR